MIPLQAKKCIFVSTHISLTFTIKFLIERYFPNTLVMLVLRKANPIQNPPLEYIIRYSWHFIGKNLNPTGIWASKMIPSNVAKELKFCTKNQLCHYRGQLKHLVKLYLVIHVYTYCIAEVLEGLNFDKIMN